MKKAKGAEKQAKRKKSIGEIVNDIRYSDSFSATATKCILMVLAAGPLLVAGAVAPGLLEVSHAFTNNKKYSKGQYQNAIRNLKYRKFIKVVREKDGKTTVKLTNKGKQRVREFSFYDLQIPKPKKWDRKWRVLMFDIPTQPKIYNQAREALRNKIKELKFVQLQKSVWAYPYECEDEILFLAETFKVTKFIEILTVERLLHEDALKRKFELG